MARKYKAAYCKRRGQITNERVLRADEALGHLLPKGAKLYDYKGTLIICQDQQYHALLKQRAKAVEATGVAEKLTCHLCGKYDVAEKMVVAGKARYHKDCHYLYCKEKYQLVSKVTNLYCSKGHWKDGIRGGRRYCKQCTNEYFREWIKRKRKENDQPKVQGT